MQDKKVIIAVVENENRVLLRKKPEGSPPYQETWYLFGTEEIAGEDISRTIVSYLKDEVGIETEFVKENGKDEETKQDHDGETKHFVYTDVLCKYKSGEPRIPTGVERVEWIEKENLKNYDLVPPSVVLFKKIGYLL